MGDPRRRDTLKQNEVVSQLWEFARQVGAPIDGGPDGHVIRERLDAIGPALGAIMGVFGYKVAPLE